MITIIFVLVLILFILKLRTMYIKNIEFFKNIPGPKHNIFIGSTFDFIFKPTYEFFGILMKYLDNHGSTIIVRDGPFSQGLITKEAEFVKLILSSTTLLYKGGPYEYLHSWLGTGLLTSAGTKWKKHRHMLTPSFHFSILDNFIEIFDSVGDIFIQKLKKETGKSSVDINPLVSLMTLDVICEAAMGTKINAQSDTTSKYVKKVKVMCSIIIDRMFSPLPSIFYPMTINYFREKLALKVLHAHTDNIIDKQFKKKYARRNMNHITDSVGKKKRLAFLDLLMISTIDEKFLSKKDIREEVDTFMFEGHDTTSSAISFAMYSIAMHPKIQEKLLIEQKNIFGELKNAKPSIAILQEMRYLGLVIKETLRLYPSVPFFGRTLTEDLQWGNNLYPKGLNIMIFAFAMHRDPKYFPNPLDFIPERFEGSTLKNNYVYVPFSAGPRNCIGQKFAMLELKSILSKVIRNFELLPSKPMHSLKLAPATILVSKNGVCISLKERVF